MLFTKLLTFLGLVAERGVTAGGTRTELEDLDDAGCPASD